MPLSLSAATSTTISTSDPPEISASSIAKRLASPNPAVRNRMVRNLSGLLPSLSPLPESTLLKIWKGLFFCYWHSDKSLYQSNLATSISALISTNSPDFATAFLDASLLTLRREWGSIDFLRMDKFYLLVRRILKHTFLLLRSNSWDSDILSKVMSIIEERALGEVGGAKGFSYHVVEIFPEELNGFLPVNKESLELLINPFLTILEKSTDSILVKKVKVNIFEKCLVNGTKYLSLKKSGGEIEKGSDVDLFGIIGLIMCFSEKMLDLAKKEETVPDNKNDLHDLRAGFYKLEMDLKKSGIDIEISVPEQIVTFEIGTGVAKLENGGGPSEKLSKKRKKNKNKKEKAEKKVEKITEIKVVQVNDEKDERIHEKKDVKKGDKKNKKKKMKIDKESNKESNSENKPDGTGTDENGTNGDERETENTINFDETQLSNLQKQFETAASEAGMSTGDSSTPEQVPINTPKKTKKRRLIETCEKTPRREISSGETLLVSTGGDKNTSSKKSVRFSIKDNVVWKPSTPLPPISVRLPPSATPRGSALKKGVPAGPVREMEAQVGNKRRRMKSKSARKGIKSTSLGARKVRRST